jgi:aspartyl-tRNA(Asn)/glutamyl-tRNA(Gln) amidotransferase subunit C
LVSIIVSKELVLELAKASRLDLSNEEITKFTHQLNVILDAFKELDELFTDGIEPSYHPLEIKDRLRDDVPIKWHWDPLANVEDKKDRYIRGPKIR